MSPTTGTDIVLGPRTRLGRTLVSERAAGRTSPGGLLRLVARHDDDVAALAEDGHAGPVVVDPAAGGAALVGDGTGPITVYVCALGPVHPDPVDPATDWTSVARDLETLRAVVEAAGRRPLRLVLVSTVVALAPTADRRYYAGWKNLVEAEVQLVAASAARGTLDVLYPGRLVDDADQPWHRLHATYREFAQRLLRVAAGRRISRVVGRDARLWLLVGGIRTALAGLLPATSTIDPGPVPLDSARTPFAPKETAQ